MKILHVCQYGAPYEGNFIKSLLRLEEKLIDNNDEVIYAFMHKAKNAPWMANFSINRTVYFLDNRAKGDIISVLRNIINLESPNIIHTHFDGYDIPVVKANDVNSKVIWHLHNSIMILPDILRNIYQRIYFMYKFKYYSKSVYALAVSSEVKEFVERFGMSKSKVKLQLNGIDPNRISPSESNKDDSFAFLSFGGISVKGKGTDIILSAFEVINESVNAKLFITEGEGLKTYLSNKYSNKYPSWLEVLPQNDDVNYLFSKANYFISASRGETFSFAIAEAALYGLPIISSDIPGVNWAKELPTVSFFKSGNVESLIKIIMSLYEDDKFTKSDLENTRKIILQKYTADKWASSIFTYYQTLLSNEK